MKINFHKTHPQPNNKNFPNISSDNKSKINQTYVSKQLIQFVNYRKKMGIFLPKPITEKKFHSGRLGREKFTLCQMQGWRREMEDASICELSLGDGNSLFAVFDGHGGYEVSAYVSQIFREVLLENQSYKKGQYENAMVQVFEKIDKMLRSDQGQKNLKDLRSKKSQRVDRKDQKTINVGYQVGCTANVVLVTPLVYVVANCGDSRSVLSNKKKMISLSFDHKPQHPTESQRIEKAGGRIVSGRINGNLNLSRGFGDFRYKNIKQNFDQTIVTCMPDVRIFPRCPNDQFILIGCDGIFERYLMDEKPLTDYIRKQRKAKRTPQKFMAKLFDELLAKDLNQIVGCDNMTLILLQLNS